MSMKKKKNNIDVEEIHNIIEGWLKFSTNVSIIPSKPIYL